MTYQIPILDQKQSVERLRHNLQNIVDTGKILAAKIKEIEAEIESRYAKKN